MLANLCVSGGSHWWGYWKLGQCMNLFILQHWSNKHQQGIYTLHAGQRGHTEYMKPRHPQPRPPLLCWWLSVVISLPSNKAFNDKTAQTVIFGQWARSSQWPAAQTDKLCLPAGASHNIPPDLQPRGASVLVSASTCSYLDLCLCPSCPSASNQRNQRLWLLFLTNRSVKALLLN